MKILIIRFSSIGDVLQTLSVLGALHQKFPDAEIHWVTREEFAPLIERHPGIKKIWALKKGDSFLNLLGLSWQLEHERFTHVYDAHNNLRSHVIGWFIKGMFNWRVLLGKVHFLRRSIFRFRRFLLFQFRVNWFPKPFSGQKALLEPLKRWGISQDLPPVPQLYLPKGKGGPNGLPTQFVAIAASAAFELKRWPVSHWIELIQNFPDTHFVLLGGRDDTFLEDIAKVFPNRVLNLSGRLSLLESAQVVRESVALVSNDTGLMHVAEQIGKPCIALMGPAPFGFPSRPSTKILELDLECRPCSKHGQGPCTNPVYQQCLRGIKADQVTLILRRWLNEFTHKSLSASP